MDLDLIGDMTETRYQRMFFSYSEANFGVFDDKTKKYVAIIGFTIMVWDHVDTFTTEVEYVWPRVGEKKPIVYLFLINRYLIPLGFIFNLVAYFNIDAERCKHVVRFEGAMTMIGINIVGLMMLIRIYALYKNQKWVVAGVAVLLLVEMATYSWLMSTGIPVQHHPNITCMYPENNTDGRSNYLYIACTMIFGEKDSVASSSSAWLPLLYDTVVLILTLRATIPSVRNAQGSTTIYIMKQLLKDGLMYYGVIFAVTLVLTVMIIDAGSGLKNITAQLELLITVTMMSRITLNLMRSPHKHHDQHDIFLLTSVQSRAPGLDQNNTTGELQRPYSLSVPITLPPHPSSRTLQTVYPPSPEKGKDRDYGDSPNHTEFDYERGLAFSSHPYATTRPRLE
ncbi:hypothetical protein DFH05DRAFT_1541249 [Lentinula detonsa]|uniref:DUF6533 domain-containing protein n=1 Tax=Lentinula detonsa TaxID=2804962 RepID=A0A9W8P6B9_9AGAR|nr:hypothetical protein DFH05DRAFT_1541249 [Lentinula detonsa]